MQKVNIYMISNIHGPKEKDGHYGYVMEMERENREPVTLNQFRTVKATQHGAEVKMLSEVLGRLTRECELHIYTESTYIASALNCWMKKWWEAGWKTAKGEEVSHMEEWKKIAEILVGYQITVHLREEHSYKNWLERELVKKGEK